MQKEMEKKNNQIEKHDSPFKLAFTRFRKNKMALFGLVMLAIIIIISVSAPLLTEFRPGQYNLQNVNAEPNDVHLLGTDDGGEDNFTKLVYGGRVSLIIGFFTMLFTVSIGIVLGSIAGYFGGKIDNLIMRFTDLMLNFPFLMFVLVLVTVLQESSIKVLIIALALTSWPATTRLVRGVFLSLREMEYVQSAKAIGNKDFRIIFRHMMPNAIAPIIVNATLLMANMIVVEAALGFLGFGVPEPTPTWGKMLGDALGLTVLQDRPWQWIPAGMMVLFTVLSINFIGDGLRDAFDTKSTRR